MQTQIYIHTLNHTVSVTLNDRGRILLDKILTALQNRREVMSLHHDEGVREALRLHVFLQPSISLSTPLLKKKTGN